MLGSAVALLAAAGAALAMQGASPAAATSLDRKQIEQIVHDYILAHPEILPEAMERLKAKRTTDSISNNRTALETPYAGSWEGTVDGDVVLVEFFDYACGYCKASLPDIERLLREDRKLKVVYRELPILSPASTQAARVSMLAARQGRYVAFHKALYDNGRISPDSILPAAVSAGIDRKTAAAAMDDKSADGEIDKNITLAQQLQASGTPTFVVGDQVLNGAVGYDALKEAIAAARAR